MKVGDTVTRYTEAKKASNKKWDSANLDRMSLALPAGSKERITIAAAAAGQSVNAYIGQAINERIEREANEKQTDKQ